MVPKRKLGSDGPLVSAIGYGAMGLAGYYDSAEENEALATIQHALVILIECWGLRVVIHF